MIRVATPGMASATSSAGESDANETAQQLRRTTSIPRPVFFDRASVSHVALGFEEDTMTKRETLYARFERFEEQIAHCYFMLHERFIANPALARRADNALICAWVKQRTLISTAPV